MSDKKNLLLTGASRGIGHATVKHFNSADWRVITVSRKPFNTFDCPWASGKDNHVQLDLSDADSVQEGIAEIRKRLDGEPLHALVNNAGISPKGDNGERLTTLTTDLSTWHHVLNVNLLAPIVLARGLFDDLKAADGAAIVNVTSIAGVRVHPFAGAAYAASKAALAALTREMAAELGKHKIRVNAIAPGEIETSILSPGTEELVETIPLHRLGRPEEVAAVIYFLCTAPASYVNGTEVEVNGGQHV